MPTWPSFSSRRAVSIQASGTWGFTSRSKNASTRSARGTLSVSRSSGSGSGSPSASRQMAAVSSRSERAERMARVTGAASLTPACCAAASSTASNSPRSLIERGRQRPEKRADRLLLLAACGLLLGAGGALLLRLGQRLEPALLLQARDALGARLEVEAQGALDGDLAEAEVGRGEDLADDDLVFLPSR